MRRRCAKSTILIRPEEVGFNDQGGDFSPTDTSVGVDFIENFSDQSLFSDDVLPIGCVDHIQETFLDQKSNQLHTVSFG